MCEVIKNDKVLCLKVTPHHLMTTHRQVDKGGIVNKFKTNKRSTKQKEDHRSDDIQLNIRKDNNDCRTLNKSKRKNKDS